MAKNNNLTDFVRDLADGFREKLGWETTDKINPQDFRDFVEHSPSVGTLNTGLESLNWERTIQSIEERIMCPAIQEDLFFDRSTGKPLLPLIRFQFTVLDPLEGDENIRFKDASTSGTIVILDSTNSTGAYIVPVFASRDLSNVSEFPNFDIFASSIREGGVRLKMEAKWVQIGSTQYPMFLSGASMRGYK